MTLVVLSIVLVAAALHATWNAVVKSSGDKMMTTAMVTGSAALLAVASLPFLPAPAVSSWPFIAASSVFSIGYFILVARTYRISDMSQTYPVMRGTAPLLVAVSCTFFLNEPLTPLAWLGVALICAGIISMAATRQPGQGKGVFLALLNATVIAGYTLIDGAGVRRSGAPAAYTLWIFLLSGTPLAAWAVLVRRNAFWNYIALNWRRGAVGGVGTVTSYGLALWAMTVAPIAVVAALRETSILFATVISGVVLKEKVSRARIAGALTIAAGAVVLRLA